MNDCLKKERIEQYNHTGEQVPRYHTNDRDQDREPSPIAGLTITSWLVSHGSTISMVYGIAQLQSDRDAEAKTGLGQIRSSNRELSVLPRKVIYFQSSVEVRS